MFAYSEVDQDWYQVGGDLEGDGGCDIIDKVSLSGNGRRVAVTNTWNEASYVYVYGLYEGEWVQIGEKLTGETSDEDFGESICLSLDGKFLAVGSPALSAEKEGVVRLYQLAQKDGGQRT